MAVLGIATAAGWILYLSSPAPKGPESTTSVEHQLPQTDEQLSELMTQFDLLTADYESLIQENLALHTLNESLNETKEAEDNQKNERRQLLVKVNDLTTQLENLSKLASQFETTVSDTTTIGEPAPEQTTQTESVENAVQTSSEETSELAASLDELNGEMVASLKESVNGLQNERRQLLAKVDQLEKIQEEEAIRFSEQFDKNNAELKTALQRQQEQSEKIVQLTERLEQVLEISNDTMDDLQPATDSGGEVSEVADTSMETTGAVAESSQADQQELELVKNLKEFVDNLQIERRQLLAQVDQLEKIQEEETIRFSEQLDKNNAELKIALQGQHEQSEKIVQLTERLEQVLEMSNDTMDDLQPATDSGSEVPEVADTSMETTPADVVAESSRAGQQVLNLEQTVKNLNQSVSNLKNQFQTAQNEADRLALQLDSSNRRTKYLEIRLRYASKHLRRYRAKTRETEVKSENLEMERQELQEKLSETSSTLNQSIAEKESEIDFLVSKFSMIRLESDVIFDSGSARLSTQGLETLRDIAQKYQDYPDRIMSIEGHTDNKLIAGNLARFYPTNWELSAARAAAAANFLTQQGVPEDKLRIVGFGALQPIASNDTEEGRASNRRIEIRLAPKLSEVETN